MKKLAMLFIFLLSTSMVMAGLEDKVSLEFKDVDIRDITKIICKSGDFGIALEKSIRGNLTISIKDVSVSQALDIVCQASGFTRTKIGNTIFVTDKKRLENQMKVIKLKNFQAEEMAKILLTTIKEDIKVAADLSGNSIVVNGTETAIEKTMMVIGHLDRLEQSINLHLKVVRNEQTIHEFNFLGLPGEKIEFDEIAKFEPVLVGEDKKHNFNNISGFIRVEKIATDGYCSGRIKAEISNADRKNDSESLRKFSAQFSIETGKAKEVFTSRGNDVVKIYLTITP